MSSIRSGRERGEAYSEGQGRRGSADVGHGSGKSHVACCRPDRPKAYRPTPSSTDMHSGSFTSSMKDMSNVMSKFLALGLPLDEVILRSTWNPAREIKQEQLGHLSVARARRHACGGVEARERGLRFPRHVFGTSHAGHAETDLRNDVARRPDCLRAQRSGATEMGHSTQRLSRDRQRALGVESRPRSWAPQLHSSFLKRLAWLHSRACESLRARTPATQRPRNERNWRRIGQTAASA